MSQMRHFFNDKRLGRFIVTGLGSTLLHTATALLLIDHWKASPPVANGIAFSIATLFSYVVNTLWSFSTTVAGRNLQRFLVVSVIGLLLATGLAWIAESIGWPPIAGIAMVVAVVPITSFALHRLWTYR